MSAQIIQNPKYPSCERKQKIHDILLVSSFTVWAMLIGFSPVLAVHFLMGA